MEMSHDFVPSLPQMTISFLGWASWNDSYHPPILSPKGLHIALLGAAREDQCLCYRLFLRWSQVKCV